MPKLFLPFEACKISVASSTTLFYLIRNCKILHGSLLYKAWCFTYQHDILVRVLIKERKINTQRNCVKGTRANETRRRASRITGAGDCEQACNQWEMQALSRASLSQFLEYHRFQKFPNQLEHTKIRRMVWWIKCCHNWNAGSRIGVWSCVNCMPSCWPL